MSENFSNFVDLLSYRASTQSEKVVFTFLSDGETVTESLTYSQLDERVRAIAATLQSLKATGERALLLYQPGLEFIAAFFGCLYAGVIAVPAYPPRANRSLERLQAIVSDAQANFALTTEALVSTIEGRLTSALSTEALRCITTDQIDSHLSSQWQLFDPPQENLAFLQYTSGSTGTPKGVMVSHGNLIHNSNLINRCFRDTSESKGVSWLPPYHDMGLIGGILQPIYVGASQALMPPVAFLQRPYRWLQAISRDRLTTCGAPNFAYELCASQITPEQLETLDLSCWTLAFTGAEPVRAETIEGFVQTFAPCGFRQEAFYPCYGMAETTLIVSGGLKEAPPILKNFDGKALEENKVISASPSETGKITLVGCGRSAEDQKMIVVNPETLKLCHSNEIGEIWVSGTSVTQGYWNRHTQTEETFKAYTADTHEGPFLRTGDLGFLHDGELFVTGRLKDLIIIRGRNHYPQDLELTVEKSHEAIKEASGAAFSVDVAGEECLVITYEVKRSYIRKLNVEEVASAIRKAVAQNHELQPFAIAFLKTGSIPKTSSGKIQRHACKAGFLEGNLDVVGEWRNSDQLSVTSYPLADQQKTTSAVHHSANKQQQAIQGWLIENIARRLGILPQEIDVREPFASYGLDSVQAVRLTAELEDWLGRKLSPTLAYDYPTIEALASYLGQGDKEAKKVLNSELKIHNSESIAIVGIGCRFPGANNPEAFWKLLCEGKDAVTRVKDRWESHQWGGFLAQIDHFDPQFFGITPREAKEMDPQQRLLLEVSWEALENAGIAADKLSGSTTGVFVGISSSDYSQIRLQNLLEPDAYAGTGNAHSIAANRLSYFFDLRGPSLTVDTACSSSLVAIHLALRSLQNGECDRAIAGGVNVILSPELTQTFTQAGMMSPDGRCKTFDEGADGYVRGEGCGVVILKRLSDAQRDGDRILAVIRGSAINQDGRSNGLTAPNGLAQQAVIRQALENAGVNPSEISYVETHGTGTSLGDPIEVNSLKTVLMPGRSLNQPLWLGSVKTNIGHLEAAAGIAGLIKVVLCLQYEEIPPHLHLSTLNPHIDLQETPISIPTQRQLWQKGEQSRFAGVSSFGFGGTNAHVVLGEYLAEAQRRREKVERPLHLLSLSAKSETGLKDLVKSYEKYLTDSSEVALENLCFTANTGRSHFNHRLAIVTDSAKQLQEKLAAFRAEAEFPGVLAGTVDKGINQKIAFLFTGQGSQYVGMGYQLYQTQPTFRAALDQCAEILQPYLEKSLLEVLYPQTTETNFPITNHQSPVTSLLDETVYTQPALFALEYALAQLWQSWGIKPSVVMGHSVGEYVAACIAGVFSLEDGLKLIAHRGKLMQALPQNGEMVAVLADEATVRIAIEPYIKQVAIAAINGFQNIVISGETEAIQEIISKLTSQGIKTKRLQVSHAFHSPLMEPMLADFEQIARQITYSVPHIDIISNLTGELATEEIATPQYWVNHVRQPVKFASSIEVLKQQNYQIFLEIGAKPTLLGIGRTILEASSNSKAYFCLPSLRPPQEDWQQILTSLATLSIQGITIDWSGFDKDYQRQRIWNLPTYPFQRQRYWIVEKAEGRKHKVKGKDWYYQVEWQVKPNILNSQVSSLNSQSSWLIFADREGLGKAIEKQLKQLGQNCILIYPGDKYKEIPKTKKSSPAWEINPANPEDFQRLFQEALASITPSLKGIIHLWSLDTKSSRELTLSNLDKAQILGCGSVLHLIQTLSKQAISSRLWLITRETQFVDSQTNHLSVAQSPLWGLGKVIALEHPEYWGGIVDLSANTDEQETSLIIEEILNSDGEDYLAFRNKQRYVARLKKVEKESLNCFFSIPHFPVTYLITGGLGSVGLKVAQWLVQQGAKNLVLVGRNKPSESAICTLKALELVGVKILVTKTDISNKKDTEKLLEEIKTSMPQLRGIIHAAGVLDDGILQGLSWERFAKVLAPKIKGTWNLHQLTQDIPLDFFIMFSSAASLLGSPGQGNYAAANAFLDAIAHYRKVKNLPALSINWGSLSDGMATTKRLAVKGLNSLTTEEGLEELTSLISGQIAQIGILSVNWEELNQQFPYLIQSSYFQEIVKHSAIAPQKQKNTNKQSSIFEQLLKLSFTQREEFLISYLQTSMSQIMQVNGKSISPNENLLDIGADSLMVMEAINQLKSDLQLMLYPREFYERPRIDALAKYLASEFEKSYGKRQSLGAISQSSGVSEIKNNYQKIIPNHQPLTISKKLPGIVFILSSPRAGSTLFRVMLAGHPDLCSPPELHLLPFDSMTQRDRELALSHLGEGLQRAFMELKGIDAQAAQKLVANLVEQNSSIHEVYSILQELAGQRLLVDKSPTYAFHRETLERAEAIFTGAKYIHLVRHPYAVIESFCRLRMDKLVGSGEENPYELAEEIWTRSNQNILDFFEQIDPNRRCLIRYEDLVKEPAKVTEELCQFLGVPFDPSLLNPYEGERMTDGVYDKSMSVGDPNFHKRKQIDPNLADSWKDLKLPHQLSEITRRVALSFNYELPNEEKAEVKIHNEMSEQYINIRGLNLCLCSWGEKNNPLVLCLHGILEQGAAWHEVAVRLAEQGYRVVAPDFRGHGRSDRVGQGGSYNLLDFLADLDAIAEQLTDNPFTLVGHSLGSVIAAMFASIRSQKVKNLILVETVLPTEVKENEAVKQLTTHLNYLASPPEHQIFPDVATAAERLRLATPSLSESLAMQLAQRITEPYQDGVRWRWDSLLRTRTGIGFNGIDRAKYLGLLRQIKAPITLIYGNRSDFNRPEDLVEQQKAMPDARRIVLSGGHNLHLEAPSDLAKVIVNL